jgi:hypothetical protein
MYRNASRPTRCAALLLGLATGLAAASGAVAATIVAAPGASTRAAAPAEEIRSGRVSGFDRIRGILVVGGQTWRVDPQQTAFSDDRAKPVEGGLLALRAGDKVTVRGQRINATLQAVQVIVHD